MTFSLIVLSSNVDRIVNNFKVFGELLLMLAIFLIAIGVPIFLGIVSFKWAKKKGLLIYWTIIPMLAVAYFTYEIYTAIYPTDSFYFYEFKQVTLRNTPKSAIVRCKYASYPDFHGDYCSASLMTVSEDDYLALLNDLSNDRRITKNKPGEFAGSDEFNKVMKDLKTEQIVHGFTRSISGQEDHYLYIGFLDDRKTIVLSVCVT